MATQKDLHASENERTEWPHNPPLPPRELDPTGEGDALRSKARPGDDTVFAANAHKGRRSERAERQGEEHGREEQKSEPEGGGEPRPPVDR